ncbi:molybdopterin-dependent oxidoreductase [Paenibacillus sp. CF384]|uniref:molybdopterin-dependent oxidoreductase n=1 Tax=Paenibacillus sp. CF384 TaxID=1884382 RepID=UPI000894FFCA|nr:molybdopterin-dependent oxidoreductase [Paenibacillus sp. CF384]SDX71620.1 Oxidoreductase molybdopterin binding domain-containing protein [Paenibacillus sp. CF384]
MGELLSRIRKGFGKKLALLHTWNGWIVVILALSGLMLLGGYWRGVLGEGRVWLKWIHIVIGIASMLPVVFYLLLAAKHWKQLKEKRWQKLNILVVLGLLLGWFLSGVLLWQFRAVGPRLANSALWIHDMLTWGGIPYVIYHSITRLRWLKEPGKRTVKTGREKAMPASDKVVPQSVYSRRAFVKWTIGAGIAVAVGPSFLKWLNNSIGSGIGESSTNMNQLAANNGNQLLPAPQALPASSPPIGGGAQGRFRLYTVTPIPKFNNNNWSFTIDGLVDNKMIWNWEQFVALKRKAQVSDFHCVTGWSVYNNTWEGIRLKDMLQQAGIQPGAKTIKFHSADGVYTDMLTLEQAQMEDVMIAVLHDGNPISNDFGGPVRLIVPKMYAYKSVKWLSRIEVIEGTDIGYWEQRGYSSDAWV